MFHVKHEAWARLALLAGVADDLRVRRRLELYVDLLLQRAIPEGMVGAAGPDEVFERHILDSVRAVRLIAAGQSLADAGSGAGLPGIPIAVLRPDLAVSLIEQRRKRARFLDDVIAALDLENADVLPGGLGSLSASFDVVTARALGDARKTWRLTSPLLSPAGRVIYWAGVTFDPRRDAPRSAHLETILASGLAKAGPLVIMTPQ